MNRYTILNPEGFNNLPIGTDVQQEPDEVNAWIEQGALLQAHMDEVTIDVNTPTYSQYLL